MAHPNLFGKMGMESVSVSERQLADNFDHPQMENEELDW